MRRPVRFLGGLVLLSGLVTGAAGAATELVTSAADSGAGTFRAAVEAANASPAIDTIEFDDSFAITLESAVVYTGPQNLTILGGESTLRGNGDKDETWDAGLFASRGSTSSLTIENLEFHDSFNNGIGVFVARTGGTVTVALTRVTIETSRFYGLYVDDQITDNYNTDDVPQFACVDPWAFQSSTSLVLHVVDTSIVDNGTVIHEGAEADFDASIETGCPVDFDGIRVDEGANGGIRSTIVGSTINGNRADGVELDERGNGGVESSVVDTQIEGSGDTGTDDTEDGFDIDETDNGDIVAHYEGSGVVGSFDEGIDLTEGGNGSLRLTVIDTNASENEDEGIKVEEGGNGDLWVSIEDGSTVNGSLSQQGIEALELGNGSLFFSIADSNVSENDNDGIALTEESKGNLRAEVDTTNVEDNGDHAITAEQEAPGVGVLLATNSDLTDNDDTSLDLDNVTPTLVSTTIDP